MSEPVSEPVYIVAVGANPLVWVVYCEICDESFGIPTADTALLDLIESEHKKAHNLS